MNPQLLWSSESPRRLWTVRRIAAAVLVCGGIWVGYAVFTQAAAGQSLDGRITSLTAENGQLQRDIAQRQQEIAAATSRAWLEQQARKLGYVVPGENVYVLSAPGVPPPKDGGVDQKPLPGYFPTVSTASPTPTPTPATVLPSEDGGGNQSAPFTFTIPNPPSH